MEASLKIIKENEMWSGVSFCVVDVTQSLCITHDLDHDKNLDKYKCPGICVFIEIRTNFRSI